MSRVEHLGEGVVLHLGDCREIAPTLGRFDALITDPPYEAEAHTPMRRTRNTAENGGNDALDFGPIDGAARQALANVAATQCDGWALIFCQVEGVAPWQHALVRAGAKYRRAMVWIKPDSSPQFNGQGPAQGHESIVAAWCGNGASRWHGGGKRGVFIHSCRAGRDGDHPTEKPVALMEELMALFPDAGASILDPYTGSGTTGVAAVRMGHAFTGIEIEPRYFDTACRRIAAELARPRLPLPEPVAKAVQTDMLDYSAAQHQPLFEVGK